MARAESGILGPAQGWAIERFGPRTIMTVGIIMFGLGFIALSQVQTLLQYYLAFAVLAIGSSLGGFMTLATTTTNWFSKRRATAMGLMMTGMGIGGFALVPLVTWSLAAHGWRPTAFASGVAILVVGIPVAQLMRHSPEKYGLLPDGVKARYKAGKAQPAPAITGFTAKQALRTKAFWMLSLSHGAALLVVGAALLHQIPHMVEDMGLSDRTAAVIVSMLAIIVVASQLFGGFIGDRINKRAGIAGCMLAHAAGFAIFAVSTSLIGAIAFALLHGMAWGVRAPLINSIRADYFGRASYATIMGFMSLFVMIGMTTGPLFAAWLFDVTGSYRDPFLILSGAAALGSISALLARKPKMPEAAVEVATSA
jgi:MFS family permease